MLNTILGWTYFTLGLLSLIAGLLSNVFADRGPYDRSLPPGYRSRGAFLVPEMKRERMRTVVALLLVSVLLIWLSSTFLPDTLGRWLDWRQQWAETRSLVVSQGNDTRWLIGSGIFFFVCVLLMGVMILRIRLARKMNWADDKSSLLIAGLWKYVVFGIGIAASGVAFYFQGRTFERYYWWIIAFGAIAVVFRWLAASRALYELEVQQR